MLYDKGQRDAALPMLEELSRGKNATPEVWLLLARTYYEKSDLPASEKAFTKAVALRDYQTGARKNAIMAGIAKPLSRADIEDVSAYLGSLPGPLDNQKR